LRTCSASIEATLPLYTPAALALAMPHSQPSLGATGAIFVRAPTLATARLDSPAATAESQRAILFGAVGQSGHSRTNFYSGTSAPLPLPSEPWESAMALPESLAVALQINPLVSKIISVVPLYCSSAPDISRTPNPR
jgi:hypothetical protein